MHINQGLGTISLPSTQSPLNLPRALINRSWRLRIPCTTVQIDELLSGFDSVYILRGMLSENDRRPVHFSAMLVMET